MAKDSGPRARPITVSELIARSETDAAFPKSPDDEGRAGRRTVGASGMPSHPPVKPKAEPAPDPAANAVTGIIPIVYDDEEDFATDGFTRVAADDLLGVDLPPVEYRTAPATPGTPVVVGATGGDPDVATTAQLQSLVDGPEADTEIDELALVDTDLDERELDETFDEYETSVEPELDEADDTPEILAAAKPDKRSLRKRARRVKAAKKSQATSLVDDAEVGDDLDEAGSLIADSGVDAEAVGTSTSANVDKTAALGSSALMGWLTLLAEMVGGLVIGAGLFWGFTELWKRYVYLALILAVVVIFAIVTFAHILRKRDLATTLLALGVGMLVTIGPLVLLAA
ncbi:MAG: hypothetical protein WBG47_06820 [Gordonia sp. (in: high G+C Gram-positive bacteria)]|uniref:hypothetical protein n=1 Tax=Gordonia sp. (in: high G+C Gram-positive bacteria) TaxID=84139 RepID=UPI003C781F41